MKEYGEEEFLALSGIQHFSFCRRQWALIHIEQQWNENVRTVEGEHLHERAHDDTLKEKRGNLLISRGMAVYSKRLGIRGFCDVVEFQADKNGVNLFGQDGTYIPIPIEYKRGSPKETEVDILQLTAQAMCLEEMLLCDISFGYLYYGETKRRQKIVFENVYRQMVKDSFEEMHQMYQRRYTPKVKMRKNCKACSLVDICLPKMCDKLSATAYIEKGLEE